MKLRLRQVDNASALRRVTTAALCSALMLGLQVALAPLPNIELVSLLVILYSRVFGRGALPVIYTFVLLEGLIFGFHLWWISYLYVWTLLALAVWLLRRMEAPLGWAALSGTFGLMFGALCAVPVAVTGGVAAGFAYWISGIPFDLVHCVSNFAVCAVLYKLLYKLLVKLYRVEKETGIMKKQAFNPFLPSWEYIPDGEPYVFGDRVYLYGSHDRFGGEAYCLNDYVCWSAPLNDLADWRYEGVIFKKTQDPANTNGALPLYAPDVQKGTDGRYYLYYALAGFGGMSVAVCDEPAGHYEFLGHVKTPDGRVWGPCDGDVFQFDPGVFIDGEGRVFLYSGFSPNDALKERLNGNTRKMDGAYCVELDSDMLTVKSEPVMVAPGIPHSAGSGFEGHEFFEASSLREINGRYYFVYSSVNSHELCYAVGDRPDAPFRFGGTLVSIGDVFLNSNDPKDALNYLGNTHGGLAELNGEWYVFYHRQTNLHQFSRQACAERIEIMPDDSIRQAEVTSCGLNGGPLRGIGEYEARIACNLTSREGTYFYAYQHKPNPDPDVHPYFTQDGGDCEGGESQYIANFTQGAEAGFKYFSFDGSNTSLAVKTRGSAKGEVIVSHGRKGAAVCTIPVSPSADWAEFSAPFQADTGVKSLYFTFVGTGAFDFLSFRIC